MEKKKNRSSAKRIVAIACLSMALLIAMGAFSFAWIRNNFEFAEAKLEAGKMLYSLNMYYKETDGTLKKEELFNTDKDTSGETQSEATIHKTIEDTIPLYEGNEVFFVVEKKEGSIDFDVAISFDPTGTPEIYNALGDLNFSMWEDEKVKSITYEHEKDIDPDAINSYLANPGSKPANENAINCRNLWNTVEKATVHGEQKYTCVRVLLEKNPNVGDSLDGAKFPIRLDFCVAQKDGLPDDTKQENFDVYDNTSLENALKSYSFGDNIRITSNFTYTGDVVFTRPCNIILNRTTLTIKGNLIFSYMYGGENDFTLNTASDGHIIVKKDDKDAGGNFQIDLPNTTILLKGANNENNADIKVENSFIANAAKNNRVELDEKNNIVKEIESGLLFDGTRICDLSGELKTMLLNGSARISVSNRTKLGPVTANAFCRSVIVKNSGTIASIDLTGMKQDPTYMSAPSILIDNSGTLTESTILLPKDAMKFDSEDLNKSQDNTQIIANKGSGEMKAFAAGLDDSITTADELNAHERKDYFFSKGDKGESGCRDDIEYGLRTQFVEALDTDGKEIIIHYETPSKNILIDPNYSELGTKLTNLESYVNYYYGKGVCKTAPELTKVTVICYGEKVLLAEDYDFINTMKALTDLNLSDAVSDGKRVPDNAFNGMSALTNVKMSESDTTWGKYIFTGTNVVEITLPQSLTKLENPTKYGAESEEASLDNVKYIHTSITVVDGLYKAYNQTDDTPRYFFTPDLTTCEAYRTLYAAMDGVKWSSRFFVDNGAKRYGNYFLRYDEEDTSVNPTCEFVVYTGDENGDVDTEWMTKNPTTGVLEGPNGFNFNTISIGYQTYHITSYDDFSLYNKLTGMAPFDVSFGPFLKTLGKYSFATGVAATTSGVKNIVFEGETQLMGYSFYNQAALISVDASEVTTLSGGSNFENCGSLKTFDMPKLSTVEAGKDLYNCDKLEKVDISVIEKTGNNETFFLAANSYKIYAKFYIHTENALPRASYDTAFSALATSGRLVFVKESYADLYTKTEAYTGVTEMGENELDGLLTEKTVDGIDYCYVLDGEEAHLVACLSDTISTPDDDFVTPATLGGKTVTKIGSAAYHVTDITAKNIKISDGVTRLGNYSFYANVHKKYCIDFLLNNVTYAGKSAFRYADMAKVTGEFLEEVGQYTFSDNASLVIVNLPELSRSRPAGTTGTVYKVFENCSKLMLSYVGYSADIEYDNKESMRESYIRFVNFKDVPAQSIVSKVNTFMNASGVTAYTRNTLNGLDSMQNSLINVSVDFDYLFDIINNGVASTEYSKLTNIYFSDYYVKDVNGNGLNGTLQLPGYVYYKEGSDLTLFAVSPELNSFGDYGTSGKDYVTPNAIYSLSAGGYTSINDGTMTPVFKVTKLGNYAYGAVNVTGVDSFSLGSNVLTLSRGALSGSAHHNTGTIVTLDFYVAGDETTKYSYLDLVNVKEIDSYACYGANVPIINAINLQDIGEYAFSECKYITSMYLPSFEKAVGGGQFDGCISLAEVTLGENTQMLMADMFKGNSSLKKITILRKLDLGAEPQFSAPNTAVESKSNVFIESKYASNVKVRVHAGLLAQYQTEYASGFGGIPIGNFEVFQESSTVGGVTYYWQNIGGEAYIDYIQNAQAGELAIPDSFDGVSVVAVSAEAMRALEDKGVTSLTLPAGMKYLTFSASDLPTTLTSISISAANERFSTGEDGVLYNKAKTTVYAFPKAKSTETEPATFELPSTVAEIYAEAFYGMTKIETLTVSSKVTIGDRAFANSTVETIVFTSADPSVFAGKDIILGANRLNAIDVPDEAVEQYKENVIVDYSIISKIG